MAIRHDGNYGSCILLMVLFIGSTLSLSYRSPLDLENSGGSSESSASTVEVLRNIQKILSITRPLGAKGNNKFLKQAAAAEETEGAANALAYLTDSFGGQLAGQILSVILSSVTGDVRGILGNSLNLFQTDERRDRVQLFLDEVSQNFLKLTGLGLLTTTKPPMGLGGSTVGPILIGPGGNQVLPVKPQQAIQVSSLGGAAGLGGAGGVAGTFASTNSLGVAGSQLQQKPQQGSAASQPIIYVLPSLNQGATGSGATASKVTTANRAVTSSSTTGGDDESEEDL